MQVRAVIDGVAPATHGLVCAEFEPRGVGLLGGVSVGTVGGVAGKVVAAFAIEHARVEHAGSRQTHRWLKGWRWWGWR